MHSNAVPTKARKGHQIPLKLELQVVVSCWTQVLGTELWTSTSAVLTAELSLQPTDAKLQDPGSIQLREVLLSHDKPETH